VLIESLLVIEGHYYPEPSGRKFSIVEADTRAYHEPGRLIVT